MRCSCTSIGVIRGIVGWIFLNLDYFLVQPQRQTDCSCRNSCCGGPIRTLARWTAAAAARCRRLRCVLPSNMKRISCGSRSCLISVFLNTPSSSNRSGCFSWELLITAAEPATNAPHQPSSAAAQLLSRSRRSQTLAPRGLSRNRCSLGVSARPP